MNIVIPAEHLETGMRIATIPADPNGQPVEIEIDRILAFETGDSLTWTVYDAANNSHTDRDYHLLSPAEDFGMVLVLIDGAYDDGHEYKRTVALPAPDEDQGGDDLFDWWQATVGDQTGDDVHDGGNSTTDATVIAGPAWLVGQTKAWDFN